MNASSVQISSYQDSVSGSPLEPVTRTILQIVSRCMLHSDEGDFPTAWELSRCTGLSEHTINTHLDLAVEAGCLEKIGQRTYAMPGTGPIPAFP